MAQEIKLTFDNEITQTMQDRIHSLIMNDLLLCENYKYLSRPMDAVVKPDACGEWQKEKPSKPCLMVVKKCGLDNLEYQLFELQYYQGYLAVICDDGEEWGDYDSLQALEYFVIEYYDSKHSV